VARGKNIIVDIASNATTTATLDAFGAEPGRFSGQLVTAGDKDWIRVEIFTSSSLRVL